MTRIDRIASDQKRSFTHDLRSIPQRIDSNNVLRRSCALNPDYAHRRIAD
jgi:hypothetical protein